MSTQPISDSARYVKSIKDGVKRRFATEYMDWIHGGRKGDMPSRGNLSPALAKAVCLNLDSLG